MRKELVAGSGEVITPSDTDAIKQTFGVWVGGAGNLNVTMNNGNVLFSGVQAGTLLPIQVTKILSTSTTATTIVALWDE